MTNRVVDVAVVGAGPAGIAASFALAKNGAKVSLIEKRLSPGAKVCAGGLTSTGCKLAGIDPQKPPEYSTGYNGISIRAKYGEIRLETEGALLVTIERKLWTKERLEQLKQLGVEIRLGEKLIGLDKNKLITDKESVSFGALVAADGARSKVRRLLGIGFGKLIRAWQMTIEKDKVSSEARIDVDLPTLWLDPDLFASGYGWAFPSKEEIKVGCGAPVEAISGNEIRKAFFHLLSRIGIGADKGKIATGSIGCGYAGHRFGRIFLAGDSAGMASPLTGEGIGQALMCGEEVAREIVDPSYRSASIAELAVRHRRTSDAVRAGTLGSTLYKIAPLLLKIPAIKNETIRRYMI